MQNHLIDYFGGEKSEALILLIVGVAALVASAYLILTNSHFKGMAYPFVLVGVIQIAVGSTVYFRTDTQLRDLNREMTVSPVDFRSSELTRMKKVMENFRLYKLMELVLFAAGVLLTYIFKENAGWYFAGVGLATQSAFMLIADLFAEHRALMYVARLQEFIPQIVH